MKLTYRDDVVRSVPARWKAQYYRERNPEWTKITHKFEALQWPFSAADIDAIIGNGTWTEHRCDECGENYDTLVRIGEEPDYEARWQSLCRGCLIKAVELVPARSGQTQET